MGPLLPLAKRSWSHHFFHFHRLRFLKSQMEISTILQLFTLTILPTWPGGTLLPICRPHHDNTLHFSLTNLPFRSVPFSSLPHQTGFLSGFPVFCAYPPSPLSIGDTPLLSRWSMGSSPGSSGWPFFLAILLEFRCFLDSSAAIICDINFIHFQKTSHY